MSLVENVVGTIIVLFFFLIAGLMITANITEQTKDNVEVKGMSFFDDQVANNINSLLLITQRDTRKPMANLLGSALYFRNTTFPYKNKVFMHRGNAVIAFGNQQIDPIRLPLLSTRVGNEYDINIEIENIRQLLTSEIEKILDVIQIQEYIQ